MIEFLNDIWLFFAVPFLCLVYAVLFLHSNTPKKYKVVRETNELKESIYEVWFEYTSLLTRNWRCEGTFDTLEEADKFIARQNKERKTIREGNFQ